VIIYDFPGGIYEGSYTGYRHGVNTDILNKYKIIYVMI